MSETGLTMVIIGAFILGAVIFGNIVRMDNERVFAKTECAQYNPITSKELEAKGFDYIALGHTHKMRSYGTKGRIYNPGSIEL